VSKKAPVFIALPFFKISEILMSHGSDSVKSIFFALGANLAIAVAKFAAAIFTGSGSMMAEAVHSAADSGNQLLLFLGLKQAKKPPSADYPLGHGKEVYFWSFIVALILFSMGGLFSIYEGIHKLQNPHEITAPYVAIAVLLFSLVAEGLSLWGCMREVNKERRGKSLRQWFKDTRQSELLVVFGEDSAALLGLSFALLAIFLSMLTGNTAYDAAGSIGIGLLLVVVAIFIGFEVKALLVGQGVEPAIKKKMIAFLQQRDEIDRVYNLLTLQLGNDVMVAVKAKMAAMDSAGSLVQAINRTEAAMRQAFPDILWLFFEPDMDD
jgi:cation diffusion facilitator family transporter